MKSQIIKEIFTNGSATRTIHIVVKALELSIAPSIGFFTACLIEKQKKKYVYI
ncbi:MULTISPECIES: hypothetical protein [Clostridia]|uniref:hypothetical protein n=1 Tax=Clostridia TaxID=186801 RepID=UPI001314E27A|nr:MULTISPECIES: hypothetical protein [Clostridia]